MTHPNIIYIEDNPADSGLVCRMLAEAGYPEANLQRANTLSKALQAMAVQEFDVVLLDLHLPDAEGPEALDIVRLHAPRVAVVVLTGAEDEELGLQLMKSGAQAFLFKGSLSRQILTFAIRMARQQKEFELALSESMAQSRAVLENLDQAFFSVDVEGRHEPVLAKAMETICGRPLHHFRKNPLLWMDLVIPEQRDVIESCRRQIAAGSPTTLEFCLRRPDGELRWIQASIRPVANALRKPVRIEGLLRDVTVEKLSQERERRLQRIDEEERFRAAFLNSAAHELATPLTPLKLEMLSLLAQETDPKKIGRFQLLKRNIDRLAQLVTDLLDASRLQSGHLKHHLEPVELHQIAADVVGAFGEQAKEAGVTLALDCRVRPIVRADPLRLFQVVSNLVHNAIKFTPSGGAVHVELDADGGQCLLRVADSGVGMTMEELDGMFKPFSQAKAGSMMGTGLGLFIAKGIVVHYGGTMTCESEGHGKGCSFKVRLPLLVQEVLQEAQPVRTESRPGSR